MSPCGGVDKLCKFMHPVPKIPVAKDQVEDLKRTAAKVDAEGDIYNIELYYTIHSLSQYFSN